MASSPSGLVGPCLSIARQQHRNTHTWIVKSPRTMGASVTSRGAGSSPDNGPHFSEWSTSCTWAGAKTICPDLDASMVHVLHWAWVSDPVFCLLQRSASENSQHRWHSSATLQVRQLRRTSVHCLGRNHDKPRDRTYY